MTFVYLKISVEVVHLTTIPLTHSLIYRIEIDKLLLFAEALGARMGCGRISIGTESERGRNRRISGGPPESRKR